MRAAERKAALAAGLTRYFTGRPCKHGHVAERTASNGECFVCAEIRAAKAMETDPARVRAKYARYRAANPSLCAQRSIIWRSGARDHIAAYNKRVRQEDPAKFTPYQAARRARMVETGGRFTKADVDRIKALQRGRCACCRTKLGPNFHRDHIMPLALGGSNLPSNIQLLCPPCNGAKKAKHPISFMQERGFLL